MDRGIVAVAGPAPHPHRNALLGHGQSDHDLRQVVAMVLGVPVHPERVIARLLGVAFEIGGGGVEEQQVDLEIEQIRHGEEHRLLHLGLRVRFHQQVHRPIRLVLVHPRQPVDRDVTHRPLGGGQLRHRLDRPVRHQREQHPLDVGAEPARPEDLPQRRVYVQRPPQPVQQAHRPDRTGLGHHQPIADKLRGIGCGRVGYAQVAVDRGDQPPQPIPIQLILPAQIRQHLCLRHRADAPVVRKLDVPHHRAVPVPSLRRPQVHAHQQSSN
jgi:hypothetical protein